MHAAFALHDLKDYGAYVVIGESRFERCDIILRNIDESARQRLEGFLLQRLRGGSERCERAAVEAVRDGDDGRAAVAETLRVSNVVKYCAILVSTVPAVILYLFMQDYFVKGVMIGSVKG